MHECMLIEGAIMLEISVYSNEVLRYTAIGDWDKVQELRDRGYFVQVKLPPQSNKEIGVINHHAYFKPVESDKVRENIQEEVKPRTKHYMFDYCKSIFSNIRNLFVHDAVMKH